MELYEAALKYADYGFAVFPLAPGSKSPLRDTEGVKEATTDKETILARWKREPEANIGIATGQSGLVALDVDPRDGGTDTLRELEDKHGNLPQTLTARSGGADRGVHLIFKAPDTDDYLGTSLGPGLDVRRGGYYIVAPPSIHPDTGNSYEWIDKCSPADLPQWAVKQLTEPKSTKDDVPVEAGETSTYGQAVLDGEVARVLSAEEGRRNNQLFKASVRVYEVTKAGEVERPYADKMLRRAATATGLPQQEIDRTLQSSWGRAEAVPPERPELAKREPPEDRELDFLTIADLRDMPPPEWLVPNMVPEGLTTLYGPPSVGKTFVALDWSLSLAVSGKQVVYCVGEALKGIRKRIDAWVAAHPGNDPEAKGKFLVLGGGAFPKFLKGYSVERLRRNIDGLSQLNKSPDLLVIDTWHRSLRGGSDSSDGDAGDAIGVLDDIRNEYGTSSLVIHHPRKPGRDETHPPARGSGALVGDSDCVWSARDNEYGLTLFNEKMKDDENMPSARVQLRKSGSSVVASPTSLDLLRS